MNPARTWFAAVTISALVASPALAQQAQPGNSMSFFVTSAGPGKGGNLGGLLGADRHCQMLAMNAGAGTRTWHAYLSENGSAGHPSIHARDRIGTGPWYNAKGVMIATGVADLHSDNNKISSVGHFDRDGNDPVTGKSWNSAHDTMGCSRDEIKATGGDGLFYCFAVN